MALEIYPWVAPILLLHLTVEDLDKVIQELKSQLLRVRLLSDHKEHNPCVFLETIFKKLTAARGSGP